MRSIVYSKFGPAKEVLELKDVPIPTPAKGSSKPAPSSVSKTISKGPK